MNPSCVMDWLCKPSKEHLRKSESTEKASVMDAGFFCVCPAGYTYLEVQVLYRPYRGNC
uniref:Uncharacterized protein n=1 Tax=Magnetococcus massalia (strain MO-1) TaxID=451514 RepID=A0A1S7LFW8_MAGMO|nr:protein of unknown function [Candidatus Magnetococcus massalia]